MACGGYSEDRFQTSVDKNFFCPICTDVLKDPVQCHNQHLFCRACITEHLKNSHNCPVCMQVLTEEALSKPARIVSGYLNDLKISCEHRERGCVELVELGLLETHISVCEYKPVTCPNARCEAVVNMADLEEHTSEVCEYRQVFCEECEENMSLKKYGKHGCLIIKDVQTIKDQLKEVQDQVKDVQAMMGDMQHRVKEMFEAIRNLTTTVNKMSINGNIVIIGGQVRCAGKHGGVAIKFLDSVEVYSLANTTWSKLAPMQQKRAAATAHFYNGRVVVTGGRCDNNVTRSVEQIQIPGENVPVRAPLDALLAAELPVECYGHKTTILNDHMWLVGGCLNSNQPPCSSDIYMKPLHSTDNFLFMHRMPEPRSYHGLEVVDNELLIIGGTTTGLARDIVNTVLSYNTATDALREVYPLPFPMADMATVKHGDDVIIIGGLNKKNKYLNTVFKYNHKKRVCEPLPGMKYKRGECAAILSGNKVFVMGGNNSEQGCLRSVECFDVELHVWYELPSMIEAKYKIAAVFVPEDY